MVAGLVTRVALAAALAGLLPAVGLAQDGPPAGNEAAAKLKPVAAPAQPAAADALPLGKLKLPAGFRIEVYASGIADARSLRVGARGTVFVASPATGKVFAIDAQRAVKVIASGLRPAERPRHSRRHALHRRGFAHFQDRKCRGRARQSADAGRRSTRICRRPK